MIGIQPRDAGTQAFEYAQAFRLVGSEDAAGKSVDGVIGEAYGVVFVLKGLHDEHRSEDLFADDLHIRPAVGEYRGSDEIAFGQATFGESLSTAQ